MDSPALLRALRKTPPPVRSRVVYDFPEETLVRYMHLRQDEAAKALGIATITLKRICHRRQIRWRYRELKTQRDRLAKRQKFQEPKFKVEHQRRARRTALPSYCVYSRPVSAEVPALASRSGQAPYATQRLMLPGLTEALGSPVSSYPRVVFPAAQRPCLPRHRPLVGPAPMLPRLHVVTTPLVLLTPTFLSKSQSAPVCSPSKAQFGSLQSGTSTRLVPRSLGHI